MDNFLPKSLLNFNQNKSLGLFYEQHNSIIDVLAKKNVIYFKHGVLEDTISILNVDGLWNRSEKESFFWFNSSVNLVYYKYKNGIDSLNIYNNDTVPNIELKLKSELHTIFKKKQLVLKSNTPIETIIPDKFQWKSKNSRIKPILIDPFTIQIPVEFNFIETETLIINKGASVDMFSSINESKSI